MAVVSGFVLWALWIVTLAFREPSGPARNARTGIVPRAERSYMAARRPQQPVRDALEELRIFVVRAETMTGDSTYSAEGLARLANVIEALSDRDDASARVACDSLRGSADLIAATEDSAARAATARRAFLSAATLLDSIGDQHLVAEERAELVEVAEEIDSTRGLVEQRAAVREFFERSYLLADRITRTL